MAICIARSLLASRDAAAAASWFDCLNPHDLAMRYVAWSGYAFDIGSQTATSIRWIATGDPVLNAGRAVWHRSGRRAAGNGSLMRTAPLGVALAACPIEQIVEGALTDSLITHADPRCLLAVAAFDVAIARAVVLSDDAREPMAERRDARDAMAERADAMLAAARRGLSLAAARMRELWRDDADDLAAIASAEADLTRDLDAATAAEPGVYRVELDVHKTAGFVRVAFRLAFWHLVHTPWREAVVDVASRGGDADTNAAIVGALVGARDGVTAIPPAWLERVLGATQPGPTEWADAHHPRHLVALAAAMR